MSKLYRVMAQIFGFHETLPLNPKDIFIWKKIYKGVNNKERNHGRETFFKIIDMFSKCVELYSPLKLHSKGKNNVGSWFDTFYAFIRSPLH